MQGMKKMSYDDFWFIDQRVQTRNLRRWLIWFILLFAFVTVGSIFAIKTMYHDMIYDIKVTEPTITINEAKSTNVNGYIKGEVKNETENEIIGKRICFMLFDRNNEQIGEEYIEIDNLKPGEGKTFELKFKRNNVDRFIAVII